MKIKFWGTLFIMLLLFFLSACNAKEYEIEFVTNGGTEIANQMIKDGDTITLHSTLKEGYTFLGWYTDELLEEPFNETDKIESDLVLYAKWELDIFSISFESNVGLTIENLLIHIESSIELPIPNVDGYVFEGWYLDEIFIVPFSLDDFTLNNCTLYAKWIPNTYTISFVTNSDLIIESFELDFDEDFIAEDLTNSLFYRFDGWYLDENFNEAFDPESRPASAITLFAKWAIDYPLAYQKLTDFESIEIEYFGISQDFSIQITENIIYVNVYSHIDEDYEIYYIRKEEGLTLVYYKSSSDSCWSDELIEIDFFELVIIALVNPIMGLIPTSIDDGSYEYVNGQFNLDNHYLENLNDNFNDLYYLFDMGYVNPAQLVSHHLNVQSDFIELIYHIEDYQSPIIIKLSQIDQVVIPSVEFNVCHPNSTNMQGVYQHKILVGTSLPTSGMFAMIGVPVLSGMQAYFNHINSLGGINGRLIELIHYDNQFDPTLGLMQVESLINEDKVFGLVGLLGTSLVNVTTQLIKQSGIPSVYPMSSSSASYSEIGEGWSIFPVQPTNYYEGQQLAMRAITELVYGNNQTSPLAANAKIGVIYNQDLNNLELYEGIKSILDNSQLTVYYANITANSDISSIISVLKSEGITSLIIAIQGNSFEQIIQSMISQSLNVPVFTTYTNANPFSVYRNPVFPIFANTWLDILSDKGQVELLEFIDIMIEQGFSEYRYSPYAISGYLAAYVFVEGLKRVGDIPLTWGNYMSAMEIDVIEIPMAGVLDYSNGSRKGASLHVLKYNNLTNSFDYYK